MASTSEKEQELAFSCQEHLFSPEGKGLTGKEAPSRGGDSALKEGSLKGQTEHPRETLGYSFPLLHLQEEGEGSKRTQWNV